MFLSLQTSSCSHKRFAFSCLIRYTVIQSLYRFLCSRIIRRVCCTSLYTKGVIKRMDRLFNMDNKFFTVMGRVADLIMLNVVFLICCLPIVTIGASLTALHYVTLKMARNEESYIIRSSGIVYRFLCIWYPLYDGISVYLSGACQILQLHQKHLPQCIPDGYPSSSVYSPDGSHHSVTCRRVFY